MSRYEFDGQREGEEVAVVFRRHKMTMRGGWVFFAVMTGLGFLVTRLWPEDNRMFWVLLGMAGVGALGCLYTYALWYCSFFIVTNQRFRQVTQKSLFKKAVIDLPLSKIYNVAYVVPNMMAGMRGYGTLIIATGAGEMRISKIAKIEEIYNKIQKVLGE